jgi:hypothetical protein
MTPKSQKKGPRRNCPLSQQLGKHVSEALDKHATTEELLKTVFNVKSMLRLYSKHESGKSVMS